MKKRSRSLLAAVLAGLLLLTGCASSGPAPKDEDSGMTLSIMGKRTDLEKSYMTSIFDQYKEATGNDLDIIAIDDVDFEALAAESFAEGNGPDILMHFHNADLNAFDVEGSFLTLNDEPWADDLTESARAYCQNGEGDLLGLPFWENSVSGCYYNKTLLNSLGLKPAATQQEFDMLCQALASTGFTPICWPADGCSWMVQFGLDPVFADDPTALNRLNANELTYAQIPAVKSMVQWIANAADRGWLGDGFLDTGWSDISPALASGDAVMTFIWDTWFYTDMETDNTYTKEDFALMPVFLNTADGGTYEGGNLNMMMVNKNSPHVQEALEFLRFCAEPAHYNIAFDGISTVNCFKGQTTNIQSRMVIDAQDSIREHERVSTAASKIVGYSSDEVVAALERLFRRRTDVDGCIRELDEMRIAAAGRQGAEGFPPPDPAS